MTDGANASVEAPDAELLLRERRIIKRAFIKVRDRVTDGLKKQVSNALLDMLDPEMEEIRDIKLEFEVIQRRLVKFAVTEKDEDELLKETDEIKGWYSKLVGSMKRARSTCEVISSRESLLNTTMQYAAATEERLLKLQKIEVPKFDGDQRKWLDFKGLYTNLVHENAELKPVQKLYYLKNSMTEQAHDLIRDFSITDANYVEAWNMLCNRYDNQRGLIKKLFKYLFGIKRIKHETEVRQFLDSVHKILRGLRAAGEDVDTGTGMLTYWLVTRLDEYTERE